MLGAPLGPVRPEVTAMRFDPTQVQPGMAVIGLDAQSVGEVKQVRDTDFLVNRPRARDVYVPFAAIHAIDAAAGGIVLAIPAAEVDHMDWPNPPVPGEPGAALGDPGLYPDTL